MDINKILLIISALLIGVPIIIMIFIKILRPDPELVKGEDPSESKRWVEVVKNLFEQGEALDEMSILKECGIVDSRISINDPNNIKTPFVLGSPRSRKYHLYKNCITERYDLRFKKLPIIDSPRGVYLDFYHIVIHDDENVLHILPLVSFQEEKVILHNISYSGMRMQSGVLRAGNLSVAKNDVRDFVQIDAGYLFITNKRLIFKGDNNIIRAININDILSFYAYREGFIILRPNNKSVYLNFFHVFDTKNMIIQDGVNEFAIVIDRIINQTYDKAVA